MMVAVQKGFTLIELVTVIVILGILAAVAFPKFQSLSGNAQQAVVQGGQASFVSAAVITYAANKGVPVPTGASVVTNVNSDGSIAFHGAGGVGTANCTTGVTVVYASNTAVSVTIPPSAYAGFCSG